MFKSITVDSSETHWIIDDDDFKELVLIEFPILNEINAIISTYKSKKLNVAANLLYYFKSRNSKYFERSLKNFLHSRNNYMPFKGNLEKYLLLI